MFKKLRFAPMFKVLHIITGLNDGGAEGVLARLCLNSTKVQHVVISLMDEGKYGPGLREGDITVHCLGMHPAKPSIFRFFRMIKLIRAERPDVVQTWMYHGDLLGGIAAKLAGVKKVFWGVRHSTLEKGKSKRSTILIARICAVLSGWLPEKIICCAHEAASVHAGIGYSSKKLEIIPNGYDLSRFRPDLDLRESLRAELNILPEEFVIGLVARFDPQKDHENLLMALAYISKDIPVRCLLVGTRVTSENSSLTQKIVELGVSDQVLLLGPRTDIPAIMNALDLHVLSSSYGEAFPNVIAEAMACGTPCVTTDVGDAKEIIGGTGLCCVPREPNALARLIVQMVGESKQAPEEWKSRELACAERIIDQFSISSMVGAFEISWLNAAEETQSRR